MSTIYGVNKDSLFTVNPVTGEWTLVALLSGMPLNFVAGGLMYNTSNSTMYLTAADSTDAGASSSRLFTLNLANGAVTFVTSIVGTLGTYKSPIRGLAYDKLLNQSYAVNPGDGPFDSLNTTYILDLSNGQLTQIGSPPSSSDFHFALVYEDTTGNLYGLSSTSANGGNMSSVDKTTGVWTTIGSIIETGFSRAMTYDPTTGIFYGSSFSPQDGSTYNKTFTINVLTGAWTELGNTVNALQPQAMAVVPNAICLHADTRVELADGRVKTISDIEPGDVLVQYNGQSTPVRRNIMTGHKALFVRVPKNTFGVNSPSEELLIRHGHPLLLEGKSVPCEALVGQLGIDEVQLDKPAAIYTLLTDVETFVNMNGVLVGTWAEKAYKTRYE